VSAPGTAPVGLVLCGGRSARMGRDKALLPWGENDLLGHSIARLRAVTPDVAVLSGSAPRYADRGLAVLTDRTDDDGAIAGLLAGLEHASGRPALLLAVDLPLVPVALLEALVDAIDRADAVVPRSARGPEPLCAAYAPTCLTPIRERLARGERRMTAFWPDVHVRELGPAELVRLGDPEVMFLNVNEPRDLERAVRLSAGTGGPGGSPHPPGQERRHRP